MKGWKITLLVIAGLALLIGLDFGFGYLGVFKTKTVKKAQRGAEQEVERKVFEESQSYVEGKKQELNKLYREYMSADSSDKEAIEWTVVQSFSMVDEDLWYDNGKITSEQYRFLKSVKY